MTLENFKNKYMLFLLLSKQSREDYQLSLQEHPWGRGKTFITASKTQAKALQKTF